MKMKITSPRNRRGPFPPGPDSDPGYRRYGKPDPGYERYAARVVEAAERVGKTWIEELRWLLDFAQRPPEQLTHELSDVESPTVYEVAWFSRDMSIAERKSDRSWIVNAVKSLERKFRSLLEHGHAVFEVTDVTFVLNKRTDERSKRSGRATKLEAFHRAKNPVTRFLLGAHRLLELEGVRLRKCAAPGCERMFVKQKRAIFCGQKCAQREQTRRYRERHPEYAKTRQRKYYETKSKKIISGTNGRKEVKVKIGSHPKRSK
jgi:hypothetical protein